MTQLKKASHCWWFDSHNSAKRSPWLQSTLSELEKKTKDMLNLIGGDADSFAQRAEMFYMKRPELMNMMEDFYRSYRCLAEQHELLRSEAGTRRSLLFKSDSSNQIRYQKTWDSTDTLDYPESEVSEVDNPELEEAGQIDSMFVEANEELEEIRRNLEDKQVETNQELEYHDEMKLMDPPFRKEKDRNIVKPMNERLEVRPRNTSPFMLISPSNCHLECKESISLREIDDYKVDDNVVKKTSEVERLKLEKEALMAELEKKDEEKRHVIRQLSLTVDILKEENVSLKRFIKDSKKCSSIFEFKKLKAAFSGTGRLFGLTSQFQPSLVAL